MSTTTPTILHSTLLDVLRTRGGQWAVYECRALDSHFAGDRQCLKFGPGCTHTTPPQFAPDSPTSGPGWMYPLLGVVNLETGEITNA